MPKQTWKNFAARDLRAYAARLRQAAIRMSETAEQMSVDDIDSLPIFNSQMLDQHLEGISRFVESSDKSYACFVRDSLSDARQINDMGLSYQDRWTRSLDPDPRIAKE